MPDGPAYGGLHAGVASIARDEGFRSALTRVVDNTVHLLERRASVSVTLIEHDDEPTTVAGSDLHAFALDNAQYADGDGPCLLAARTATIVRVDDLVRRTKWRQLRIVSRHHHTQSSLSVPLTLSSRAVGSMNAYSRAPDGFTAAEERVIITLAAQASVIAVNAQAYWAAFDGTRSLTAALRARSVIDQARGVLIATHAITADDAFRYLSVAAERSGRPLTDVARDVLTRAEPGGGDDGEER